MCRYTLSHVAAQYGQTAFLYHVALRWGAEVDPLDLDSRTPLHWAAYKGYGDTVRLLLVMSARQDLADREGCTPLHWAAIRGNGEACTLLLQVRLALEHHKTWVVTNSSWWPGPGRLGGVHPPAVGRHLRQWRGLHPAAGAPGL